MAELKKAVFADMDQMIGEGILKKKRKPRAKVAKEQYTSLTDLPIRKPRKKIVEAPQPVPPVVETPKPKAPTARERAEKLLADAQPKAREKAVPSRVARLRKSLPKPDVAPTILTPAPVKTRGRPINPDSKRQRALKARAEKEARKNKTTVYEPIIVPKKEESKVELEEGGQMLVPKNEKTPKRYK